MFIDLKFISVGVWKIRGSLGRGDVGLVWSRSGEDGKEEKFVECILKVEVIGLEAIVRESVELGMIYRF